MAATAVEQRERAEVVTSLCHTRILVPALVPAGPQRATLISYVGAVLDRLIADAVAGRRSGLSGEIAELRRDAAEVLVDLGKLDVALAHVGRVVDAAFG